jgi:hypothetical protein
MRDWQKWVRDCLELPRMSGARDDRIVAELAAHLEETWREARARGDTEEQAEALVRARLGATTAIFTLVNAIILSPLR